MNNQAGYFKGKPMLFKRTSSSTLAYVLRIASLAVIILATGALYLLPNDLAKARDYEQPLPAPAFTHNDPQAWINSEPLNLQQLRGQVVLLDFWAYGCWNCYRSFPWMKQLEARYHAQGLRVIGVHTPEFDAEKQRDNVVARVKEFGLTHAVMMDNDYSYWNAIGNRYWPTFYLIDKQGRLRAQFIGEIHAGDQRARAIEQTVQQLLVEQAG
jgi:thiol-disulfide isomerase/thioredoxin